MTGTLRERLHARSRPCSDADCGCILWLGATDRDGYGQIHDGGRQYKVHRVAWEIGNDCPLPAGLVIDHVKDNGCVHKNCVNAAHLEPVTNRENLLRGQSFSAVNAAKTHCDSGHEFTEANTYYRPTGGRRCRACARELAHTPYQRARQQVRQRRWQERKKAAMTASLEDT